MAGNNSIQILRGTRESLVTNRNNKLLPGQLLYNDTDNYLTIGRLDNNSITTSAPICCRSIKGYLGEDNGLSLNSTNTLIPYSLTTNSKEVIMTVNGKVGFTVHKNGYMNLFQPAIAERHPVRYAEHVEDMAKKVDKQSAIAGLYTFYGKRKSPTEGEEWPQYENGEECVFRGGYFPNSYSEFNQGDRRVVMYGKMGTFSVDMAEDRGFTYDSSTMGKQVTNRNYVDTAISTEATTRATEDADIRDKLSEEAATRANEDSKLQDYIDQEIQTRAAEDADIRAKYVPRKAFNGDTTQGYEYQLYSTSKTGDTAFLLSAHKGAVAATIMMRDGSGAGSIATPSEWMKDETALSNNAQKIVNVNMLTEYVKDYVTDTVATSTTIPVSIVKINSSSFTNTSGDTFGAEIMLTVAIVGKTLNNTGVNTLAKFCAKTSAGCSIIPISAMYKHQSTGVYYSLELLHVNVSSQMVGYSQEYYIELTCMENNKNSLHTITAWTYNDGSWTCSVLSTRTIPVAMR